MLYYIYVDPDTDIFIISQNTITGKSDIIAQFGYIYDEESMCIDREIILNDFKRGLVPPGVVFITTDISKIISNLFKQYSMSKIPFKCYLN